jgi:hypothetical protein
LDFKRDIAGTQQQRQQDIINQQIQNFALAQEMPSQRLSGFNAFFVVMQRLHQLYLNIKLRLTRYKL